MATEKDTVRQSKKVVGTATQLYLPISEIRDDTIVLKNGGVRAILETSSINFNLKSETEQDAIIYSYQSFLNSLEFPIQIVVHSRRLEIDNYIQKLKQIQEQQNNHLLKNQTAEYIEYITRLVEYADIMEKKFYVTVSYNPPRAEKLNIFEKFWQSLHPRDSFTAIQQRHGEFEELKKRLAQRVNIVTSGLENCGLKTEMLKTQQLIEVFYKIYNPITSRNQKLENVLRYAVQNDEETIASENKTK